MKSFDSKSCKPDQYYFNDKRVNSKEQTRLVIYLRPVNQGLINGSEIYISCY